MDKKKSFPIVEVQLKGFVDPGSSKDEEVRKQWIR